MAQVPCNECQFSILQLSPEVLNTLLKDHTLSSETQQVNIFWATDDYADRGDGYRLKHVCRTAINQNQTTI